MKIGCFALVEPFSGMERQFEAVAEMGIKYADVTDTHDGASLGVEAKFTPSTSLDSHPADVRAMAENAGVELSTFCAHANLLDPTGPQRYGTTEVIKGIRLARDLGLKHVITTEGHAHTEWGQNLDYEERMTVIQDKLYEPIRWAEELDMKLLIETHGVVTDDVDSMEDLLDRLGHEENVGVCLDTGNSWLGGADPIDYIDRFGERIKHVHWKDMGEEWVEKRGTLYGVGFATIPLGDGVIPIPDIVRELEKIGFDDYTTLEIAGSENNKISAQRLEEWSTE